MVLVETYSDPIVESPLEIIEPIIAEESTQPIITELNYLVFKLRAYTEIDSENQEHAIGVEQGFERAAEMLENLIRRFDGKVEQF